MHSQALISALAQPRFEVVPLKGLEPQLAFVPPGAAVPITCSPTRGIEPTLQAARRLAGRGFRPVPHIAARLVTGEPELRAIVRRLTDLNVREIFVIGGDQPAGSKPQPAGSKPQPADSEPGPAGSKPGPYPSALDLLCALTDIPSTIESIGVAAYPERHPFVDDEVMRQALLAKQQFASYMVTQICFEPATIERWLRSARNAGIRLPVYIGLPGALDVARLLHISVQIGVGDSLRYLSKGPGLATRLVKLGGYRPDALIDGLAACLEDASLDIRGLHLNTFNQIEKTETWRHEALRRLTGRLIRNRGRAV